MNGKPHYLRQFFSTDHLASTLKETSLPFGELARLMDEALPENPEKSTCLRKLLEAKDCAVRARIFQSRGTP